MKALLTEMVKIELESSNLIKCSVLWPIVVPAFTRA